MLELVRPSAVEQFVAHYGYWAVFVLVALESAGLPLPGELTLVGAAIAAGSTGRLDIMLVIAAASGGAVMGDNLGYWIGREFGFRLLVRYGRRLRIGERQLKLGQYLFLRHGGKVVFWGRLVAVLRVLAALLAGANRMPWRYFLISNAAGGVVWATLYGTSAYLLGKQAHRFAGPVGWVTMAVGAATVVGLARYVRRHQKALEEEALRALPGPVDRHRRSRARCSGSGRR